MIARHQCRVLSKHPVRRFALDSGAGAEAAQRPLGTPATASQVLAAAVVDVSTGELAVASGATLLQLFVQACHRAACRFCCTPHLPTRSDTLTSH